MKISIITVAYNSALTIRKTIESVMTQDYPNIEYIIVDGKSSDGTLNIAIEYVEKFNGRLKIISEKDNGLYDAMNKGIQISTGDVIGILNSDDFFTTKNSISRIAQAFEENIDGVYGDVNIINNKGDNRVIRTISCKRFNKKQIRYGIIPPHPSFYVRRTCYERYGIYKTNYKISSDFDLMVRIILSGARLKRLDFCIVTMRNGGISTKGFRSRLTSIKELKQACTENNIKTNTFLILFRFIYKLKEFDYKRILA